MSSADNVSFARKYRPSSLSDYLGDHVKNIIEARFKEEKNYPQSVLLHGTRGCGKTTLGRILTRYYHCLAKVNGQPCGICDMCVELEEKLINNQAGVEVMGVTEADIASDTGKAAMDELLEDSLIEPMYPLKYKILLLDEFHMATTQSQNRLLKILEEPPKHLIIFLMTTNPEKVIGTVLSRCQLKIEVKKHSVDQLVDRLLYVCQKENITTSKEALKIIAKKSDRVPREALNMLEDIAKEFSYRVDLEAVRKRTGDIASEIYMDFYKSSNDSLEKIMLFNKKLKEQDIQPKDFIKGLTRFTLDCIYIRYGISLEDFPLDFVKSVKSLFIMYNSEEMDYLLQIIEYANKMIDSDDTKAELIITTTAMRISKVKLLSVGLLQESLVSDKENEKSYKNYRSLINQEKEETKKAINVTLDDSLLVSVFGKQVSEVKGGSVEISEKESGIEEDDKTLSDEDLLNYFTT